MGLMKIMRITILMCLLIGCHCGHGFVGKLEANAPDNFNQGCKMLRAKPISGTVPVLELGCCTGNPSRQTDFDITKEVGTKTTEYTIRTRDLQYVLAAAKDKTSLIFEKVPSTGLSNSRYKFITSSIGMYSITLKSKSSGKYITRQKATITLKQRIVGSTSQAFSVHRNCVLCSCVIQLSG